MDREILFRGKRVDNGEWVYGYVVSVLERSRATIFVPKSATESEWATLPYAVDPDTIGQYTGLTDKNGKKIFEGDVVRVNDDYDTYGQMAGEIREVYFVAGCYRLKPKYDSNIARGDRGYLVEDSDDFEVIGNMTDNPELMVSDP
jgi:uncharacterized phage protein (TIGR01671 family)